MVEFSYKRPEWIAEFRGEGTGRQQPAAYNEEAVLTLLAYRALDYNGRAYRVAPVSRKDALRVQQLQHRLRRLQKTEATAETLHEYANLLRDMVVLCGRLLIPCGWRKHVPFRRNPVRNATELELQAILDFLSRCRTTPSGRLSLAPRSAPLDDRI